MGASQSLGIITLAPVLQELLHSLGWRNTYRILGALFSLALIAAFSFDPNVEDSEKTVIKSHRVTNENNGMADNQRVTDNKLADSNKVTKQEVDKEKPKFSCEMFKRPAYILALVCVLLGCFGGLVTFVHLVKHCEEMGVAAPQAANLFIFIGISSLISSVVSGRVLDFRRMSPFYVNQFANTVLASSLLLLPQARVYWHFVLFAVFFGLGFGSFITTIYLLLLNTVEPRLRLYSFPVGEAIISAGTLGGAPLAGFIADVTGSYEPAFYTFGGILAFAALLAFPVYFFGLHNVNRDPASTVGGLHEVEVNEALELEREKNGIGNKATEEDSSDDNKNGNKTETWAEIELTSTNCQSVENDGNDNVAFDISEESTKL